MTNAASNNPETRATPPNATCSVTIDASPEAVWALVGDIANLGTFSPETTRTELLGDVTTPAVGVVFRGHNTVDGYEWATDCTILAYVVNEALSFGVDWDDHDEFSSIWTYELEEIEGRTKLSESFESNYLADPNRQTRSSRELTLIESMDATLLAIKTAVEAA